MLGDVFANWWALLLWGGLATVVMTTVLEAAQMAGLTRLGLPFLFGTVVTGDRRRANLLGYILYVLGGWIFTILYALILEALPHWWVGPIVGLFHGLFLITVFLRLFAEVHPRVASRSEGPSARRKLENPGTFGLHYGRATPVTTVIAQVLYGLVFAIGYLAS